MIKACSKVPLRWAYPEPYSLLHRYWTKETTRPYGQDSPRSLEHYLDWYLLYLPFVVVVRPEQLRLSFGWVRILAQVLEISEVERPRGPRSQWMKDCLVILARLSSFVYNEWFPILKECGV